MIYLFTKELRPHDDSLGTDLSVKSSLDPLAEHTECSHVVDHVVGLIDGGPVLGEVHLLNEEDNISEEVESE